MREESPGWVHALADGGEGARECTAEDGCAGASR
jgi:hypothetical protein